MADEDPVQVKEEPVESEEGQGEAVPVTIKRSAPQLHLDELWVKFGDIRLGIPPLFKKLFMRLTKHYVLEQPPDPPQFIASYLNDLLEKRESGEDTVFIPLDYIPEVPQEEESEEEVEEEEVIAKEEVIVKEEPE